MEIVFLGRSNVGKSSLIRALTGEKLDVGKRPGLTRQIFRVEKGGLIFTDLPGLGFMEKTSRKKVEALQREALAYLEERDILVAVLVVDAPAFQRIVDKWTSRGEAPLEVELFQFLHDLGHDVLVAANKMDRVRASQRDAVLDGIALRLGMLPPWRQWQNWIAPVSAKKREVSALKRLINMRLH